MPRNLMPFLESYRHLPHVRPTQDHTDTYENTMVGYSILPRAKTNSYNVNAAGKNTAADNFGVKPDRPVNAIFMDAICGAAARSYTFSCDSEENHD